MSDTFFVTMKYEVPNEYLSDLHPMESDGAIDQLAEIWATCRAGASWTSYSPTEP